MWFSPLLEPFGTFDLLMGMAINHPPKFKLKCLNIFIEFRKMGKCDICDYKSFVFEKSNSFKSIDTCIEFWWGWGCVRLCWGFNNAVRTLFWPYCPLLNPYSIVSHQNEINCLPAIPHTIKPVSTICQCGATVNIVAITAFQCYRKLWTLGLFQFVTPPLQKLQYSVTKIIQYRKNPIIVWCSLLANY